MRTVLLVVALIVLGWLIWVVVARGFTPAPAVPAGPAPVVDAPVVDAPVEAD